MGDWEGDAVLGGIGKGVLVTLVDRKSRFLTASVALSKDAKLIRNTIVLALKDKIVRSISLDNGTEFTEFRTIEKKLDTLVYFAHLHAPWERGTNETQMVCYAFSLKKDMIFVN